MNKNTFIIAIDQGTTSSRSLAFDTAGTVITSAQQPFDQYYPNNGWVEHKPMDIWQTCLNTCKDVLSRLGSDAFVAGIGITNQRETTLVWERQSGQVIYNAIVWQDRRTADYCNALKAQGHEQMIREKTGLLLDPYFSATKIRWVLDHVDGAQKRAENGELCFGTVDSFLIWRLTNGNSHATDATNASRTLLFNIHTGDWDSDLLKLFNIPRSLLADVKNCADDYGVTDPSVLGREIPICGAAGDQQAALIGQACFNPGMTKSTYGTGCFMVMNTGDQAVVSQHHLLTTVAYQINGKINYALEGSIFNAGTTIQWLRDELGVFHSNDEIDNLIEQTENNHGVYLVPAFTGLGAPHWDADARGVLTGITRDTGKSQLVRAALESVCYQSYDLINAMQQDSNIEICQIRVDGGMTANDWLLQFLADILNVSVQRPENIETTSLGAASLAGIALGINPSLEDLHSNWKANATCHSGMHQRLRNENLSGWHNALEKTLSSG